MYRVSNTSPQASTFVWADWLGSQRSLSRDYGLKVTSLHAFLSGKLDNWTTMSGERAGRDLQQLESTQWSMILEISLEIRDHPTINKQKGGKQTTVRCDL